ncbi:MAG: hypothetical protein JEZ06_03065 [Anaerolineaceae bacterium]|nr:hypothetical protein [Anaerolineaceae bacterium]
MTTGRTIKVTCKCNQLLFRYYKSGRGRLIKCFISEIIEDQVGLEGLPLESRPACPSCGKSLGILQMIRGRPALKLNQGTIKPIRI